MIKRIILFAALVWGLSCVAQPQPQAFSYIQPTVNAMYQVGSVAPDIVMPDRNGRMRQLSALRGKVVLLDFWASWCGPCRRESPNVVKLYHQYHNKGFEIFSVSLDSYRNNWLSAIDQDGMVWDNHVCDFKGWETGAAKTYNVTGIPTTFLIARDGTIIAEDLRGDALADKLREIFGQSYEQSINQQDDDIPWQRMIQRVLKKGDIENGFYGGDPKNGLVILYSSDFGLICGHTVDTTMNGEVMMVVEKYESNGYVYVGNTKDGEKHGNNCLVYNLDGKPVYYGSYRNDEPVGEFSSNLNIASSFSFFTLSNGDKYIGEIQNGKRNGKGLYIWKSGEAWYGNWIDDVMSGEGIYIDQQGNHSSGIWEGTKKIN